MRQLTFGLICASILRGLLWGAAVGSALGIFLAVELVLLKR